MQFTESSNKIEGNNEHGGTGDEWFYDMLADGYSLRNLVEGVGNKSCSISDWIICVFPLQ